MTPPHRATAIALCVAALAAGCGSPPHADPAWPAWRGPDGSGVIDGVPLPVVWGLESPSIRWTVAVAGRGNSSPVVADGRVFLTSATRPKAKHEQPSLRRVVLAFDLETGSPLWQQEVAVLPKGEAHRANTHAAPTPATDGRTVFAYFGSVIAALDAPTGAVLWQTQLEEDYFGSTFHGSASSPVLTEQAVIVAITDGGVMTCYEARTGRLLWKSRLGDGYRASLLAGDGRVYALDSAGSTTVVRAHHEFQRLAVNELGDAYNNASPAVAGGCLLIRTRGRLHCVDARAEAA